MSKSYKWPYRIDVPPYDKIVAVLEAFFSAYPKGDYTCTTRERYKLEFRRGLWKRAYVVLGPYVPDRLVPGRFEHWPVIVRVLVRPSPEKYAVHIEYQVHLPSNVPELKPEVQTSVDQHARVELEELAAYLAECVGMERPPEIVTS